MGQTQFQAVLLVLFGQILKDKKRVWDATGLSVGYNMTNVVFNLLWSSELAVVSPLLLFGTTFYLLFGKATRMPPSMLLALSANTAAGSLHMKAA